ncbi:MAG: prephenate dehydrogenase/arogenate dehydrogenase family protein [bacterium]
MAIRKIAIIGLGLIGGSIAKSLKSTASRTIISAFDKEKVLKQAKSDFVIDMALTSVDEVISSDLIFICLPVDLTLYTLEKLAPQLKPNQIISDVCGVKGILQQKWSSLQSKGIFIGGHPMTGKEKGLYENSDPLLFENSVYIISDTPKDFPGKEHFLKIIESFGARITFLNPFVHDKLVSNVSHLPQLLSVSLVNTAGKNEDGINFMDFAAGGFKDMTRIASSNFNIWEPVLKENKTEILSTLEAFAEEMNQIKKLIVNDNYNDIYLKFENARKKRDEIPANTKGFLSQLHDIYIFVRDEPGVISKISTALYKRGINIKDIELLKIREGTGGTFRLSFDSEKDAKSAELIMRGLGFDIK